MLETTRKAKIWLLTLALLFAVFKNGFGEGKAYAAGGDFAGGTGAQVDPYLIETADQLDKVRGSYLDTGTYFKLISDIDLGGYAAAGWNSIGDSVTPFYGHFDGDGHTISRLTNHNGDSLGLFGALSTGGWIGNLKLTDVSIVGDSLVGGLVGDNYQGTIDNVSVSGEITGVDLLGGLVGYSYDGTISNSCAAVKITGEKKVGGLIGEFMGEMNDSCATGEISGDRNVGGLIGYAEEGQIQRSYASGKVYGTDEVGGLIGRIEEGDISYSYATGDVSGNMDVGGLIGTQIKVTTSYNHAAGNVSGDANCTSIGGLIGYSNDSKILFSYALGEVSGLEDSNNVGGLAGVNSYWSFGEISHSYALGNVDGGTNGFNVGGLVGVNMNGTISNSFASGDVNRNSGETGYYAGGLVGDNTYGTIQDSYASGTVRGNYIVGGLVGNNPSDLGGEIVRSFAIGDVEGGGIDNMNIGGLVGDNSWGKIVDSYAAGKVSGNDVVGGLAGGSDSAEIWTSYSYGEVTGSTNTGGFVGSGSSATIVNSFYDTEKSGLSISEGGAGLITAQMQSQSSYEADAVNAWDFTATWGIDPVMNGGYPYLKSSLVILQYEDNDSTTGTAPASQSYVPVTEVSLPGAMDLVKSGHTFVGWNEKADGSGVGYSPGDSYKVRKNTSLYAQWIAVTLSSDATLTSSIGTVSTNGTASETITAVPYGTTLSAFKAAISPATNASFEVYEANGLTVATSLASNYKVIVTAEDGTTQVTYTVTVDPAPPSSDATLTSSIGTVSTNGTASETITAVPYGTTLSAFKLAITPAANATFEVYEADGVTVATSLASSYKVIVTAQDGTTRVTYTVTVKSAPSNPTAGGNGGGSYTPPSNKLILQPGKSGELSLLGEITVTVPVDASDKEVIITINRETDPQKLLSDHDVLLSSVFEVLKNFKDEFKNPVTITIKFNSTKLPAGQTPAIFLYDEAKKRWMEVPNGQVSGDRVSVKVRSLAKFAVFATQSPVDQETNKEPLVKLTDIAGHWAESSILQAVREGIVAGYSDGSFKPNRIVTRAEFALMLMNALKRTNQGGELLFTDSAKIGRWAKNAVALAVEAGYINGYRDGTFRPNSAITRAEMAIMVAKVLGLSSEKGLATEFKDDLAIPEWAKGAIVSIQAKEIMKGSPNGEFAPAAKATRAEAVTVLLKLLEAMGK
ncbi:S-layer homology domain-containing protein [Cohnella sp. LGH]|uniref:S-layer homology domain-containing protein n=1 Tax=Cohnella sp. LGH TaxID=1619153 RepID=UPI001ADA262C|nr:S-layer homology domain-containing protein [Cohnella sp. LGH]QTH45177.1 S-layer homology domain-containing protein [Cohnella sp. LGH]